MFQFCVLPFGLNDAPRAFTKTLKPPVGTLRSLGCKLVVYLDDIILAASTRELYIYQGQILIKTLENLGFVITQEKIKSGTFSSGPFSRLYFGLKENVLFTSRFKDSINQAECPDSVESTKGFIMKTKPVHWNVQCFKICSPQSTTSLQIKPKSVDKHSKISAHHTTELRCENMSNSQSRKDLTWWVKNLKTNCSRPIHPPPVDLSIMSDASDLAWGAHLESVRIQGFWRSYQFSWHINRKELKAAFLALKFLIPNQTSVHVQICIDNRTAVAYINHLGNTRSLELNSIAVKMWAWCLERNMFLSALYVSGY